MRLSKLEISYARTRFGVPASLATYTTWALALYAALGAGAASASSFNITGSSSTAQTLGSSQTGTIAATGSLSVSGSTVAVTVNGNNASLTNLGTLTQTGTGRDIRDNTGVTGFAVTNGSATNSTALMQSADADVIQMNVPNSSVTLSNYGTMSSLNASKGGAQAVDFNAMTGSNILNNYSTGVIKAQDADAVRPGVNGVVNNYGSIISTVTTDTGSDGVDAQNNTGVTVNNYSTGSITGARHGITGGALNNTVNFTTTINNDGIVKGNNGSGINLDGFNAKQTATITNTGTITGNGVTGDGDGIDVDGVVNINNSGTIKSLNSVSSTTLAQSEGITVGGGTIVNSGTIEGDVAAGNTNAVGRGITFAGVDTSGTAEPIYANSVVTNSGTIKGQSDSAIAVDGVASGFTVTVNNNAGGVLQGGGTTNAAVRTGADNDTINNAGTINGSSSGKAIDMGAGNNTLHVTGGAASITGNINGGSGGTNTMTISPGTGNSFNYSDSISNFSSVEVQSGHVTLSGVNTFGNTIIDNGSTLTLDGGANRISPSSGLTLKGGTLEITGAAGTIGQTFSSLALSGNSIFNLHSSSAYFDGPLSFTQGSTLTIYVVTAGGPVFALLGDLSNNADFLALIGATTINGVAATFNFDGTNTDVVPVPLPAAYVLLLSGAGLLGALGRRRKQSATINFA